MDKPERYKELEQRVWGNLDLNGILDPILENSVHASGREDYTGANFNSEFRFDIGSQQHVMWVKLQINHKKGQPVTSKIYKLTQEVGEQIDLCGKIWDGVTEDDIKYIAKVAAEEYQSGVRWMDVSQTIKMREFYPAIQENNVDVILKPKFAQYTVAIRK